jgi:hypothetical protein
MIISLSLDTAADASGAELHLGKARNGRLCLSGTEAVIGFDGTLENREKWFIQGDRLHEQISTPATNPPAMGPRTLTIRARLDRECAPAAIERLTADGRDIAFPEAGTNTVLRWLDPRGFDAVRVFSRGGAAGVSASVNIYADGTVLILR